MKCINHDHGLKKQLIIDYERLYYQINNKTENPTNTDYKYMGMMQYISCLFMKLYDLDITDFLYLNQTDQDEINKYRFYSVDELF